LIVVCGEALIDRIPNLSSPPSRRTLPSPVYGGGQGKGVGGTDSPGGGPFTTARALARLGVPTQFLGRLSTDSFGKQLKKLLVADGGDLSLTSFGPEPTTLAIADVDRDGHAAYRFVIDGTSAPNLTPQMVPASFAADVTALHVGTLGLVFEPVATTLTGLVEREHGKLMVMVDPNIRPSALLQITPSADGGLPSPPAGEGRGGGYRARLDRVISQSTIVKASDADVSWLYPDLDLHAAARALLACGPRLVVVTLGADGAFAVQSEGEVEAAAPAVKVVDTIGAGDAFGAALLAWLRDHLRLSPDLHLEQGELEDALEFACLVASITCTRAGADPPHRADLHHL
jgi:fructokinase